MDMFAAAAERGFLTVHASLFCFLLLAFVFSIRHRLARPMFFRSGLSATVAALPAVFILLTLGCIVTYHALIQQSIAQSIAQLDEQGFSKFPIKDVLEQMDGRNIPYGVELAACYLGIFISAELAFVLMAMREYLQDLLHLDERELLRGKAPESAERRTPVQSVEKLRRIVTQTEWEVANGIIY